MAKFCKYLIDDADENNFIYVVEPVDATNDELSTEASVGSVIKDAEKNICSEISKVKPIVKNIIDMFSSDEYGPKKIELELGMALSSSMGAIIVSGQLETTFKIKATWQRD